MTFKEYVLRIKTWWGDESNDYNIRETDNKFIVEKPKDVIVSTAPEWFKKYEEKQEKFNELVLKEIAELKKDIKAIKNCPTIKRELAQK